MATIALDAEGKTYPGLTKYSREAGTFMQGQSYLCALGRGPELHLLLIRRTHHVRVAKSATKVNRYVTTSYFLKGLQEVSIVAKYSSKV